MLRLFIRHICLIFVTASLWYCACTFLYIFKTEYKYVNFSTKFHLLSLKCSIFILSNLKLRNLFHCYYVVIPPPIQNVTLTEVSYLSIIIYFRTVK